MTIRLVLCCMLGRDLYKRILLSNVVCLLQRLEGDEYSVGFVDISSWVGTGNFVVGNVSFASIARIILYPTVIHMLIKYERSLKLCNLGTVSFSLFLNYVF